MKKIGLKYKIIFALIVFSIYLFLFNNVSEATEEKIEQPLENGIYMIKSAINPKFMLDVNGASKDNGANVQLYEYSNVNQKKFKLTYEQDGYYTIIAMHSNKSLDVKDASKEKGANVWQWEANGTDAQKWKIKDNKDGTYSIISKCNGLYVDVLNSHPAAESIINAFATSLENPIISIKNESFLAIQGDANDVPYTSSISLEEHTLIRSPSS